MQNDEKPNADSPEWKAMSKDERKAYLEGMKDGGPPNPTGEEGIAYAAQEAYRILDEHAAEIPAKLAAQMGTFREVVRGIEAACAGSSEGGTGAISPVVAWAEKEGRLIPSDEFDSLGGPVSGDTSEHEVWHYDRAGGVVKRTWAGVYGQVPVYWQVRILMKNASLPEYLRRMALQVAVFKSDIRFEGITTSDKPSMLVGHKPGEPSAVISQEWIEAARLSKPSPDDGEIAKFMGDHGFRRIKDSATGWAREDGVIVMDAKTDNFIMSKDGVVPIDLQMGAIGTDVVKGLEYGEGLR